MHDHRRAFCAEAPRNARADAVRGAGHERNFSCQSCHGMSLDLDDVCLDRQSCA
jgi:hypothetical protein